MRKTRVLVVDDEEGMLEVCADTLEAVPSLDVIVQQESPRAAELLTRERFDLLITDIRMAGVDGIELLRIAKQHDPNLATLVMTAYPSIETAIEVMKLGAADYIVKPFRPDDLLAMVRRLLEARKLLQENSLLQRHVERRYTFDALVGNSPCMLRLYQTIERVAASEADVLILGETGTGKELVARSIHSRSVRSAARFVPVDCGAIPGNLLESEFFGHERGAFTGANARNLGLLEFADRGTFFLDEVAELPAQLQAKLLRVLQERKVRRVGGRDELAVDVRVLAATSKNLDTEIAERRFREDLYFRIKVARIEIPPLRERLEDVPLLVAHFLERFSVGASKGPKKTVHPEALEVLSRYAWPGNVRELQNAVRSALAMAQTDELTTDDLPDEIVMQRQESDLKTDGGFLELKTEHINLFEREYLAALLLRHAGDVSGAATEAKLPRGTFYRLLKKHGIASSQFRA